MIFRIKQKSSFSSCISFITSFFSIRSSVVCVLPVPMCARSHLKKKKTNTNTQIRTVNVVIRYMCVAIRVYFFLIYYYILCFSYKPRLVFSSRMKTEKKRKISLLQMETYKWSTPSSQLPERKKI